MVELVLQPLKDEGVVEDVDIRDAAAVCLAPLLFLVPIVVVGLGKGRCRTQRQRASVQQLG